MPDVITGNTEIGNTKQDLIAAMVQKELAFRAKLTPFFTDLSSMVGPGMQSISVPKLSSFTVADRAEGVAGDISALTSSVDKLDLNQNLYVSWLIDPMTAIQSNIPAQLEFARRAAAAQARKIDELIITDSIPLPSEKALPSITVLSVASLLGQAIKRIHRNESVSMMFQ